MHACKIAVYILQNKFLFCKNTIFYINRMMMYIKYIQIFPSVGEEMGTDYVETRGNK